MTMAQDELARRLFPSGAPVDDRATSQTFELYKLMVASSEQLVARRQGMNTFFLTANGAILTAAGLIVANDAPAQFQAWGLLLLTVTGGVLSQAWRSLIRRFGQLNAGKFVIISALERLLPAAIYDAEWFALGEGKDKRKYKSFTSGEAWTPWTFFGVYCVAAVGAALIGFGFVAF